jgi:hypothetical protein
VQVAAFTGALGELVIDTTNKVVVVNDGATTGGFPQVGLTASQTITNKIYQGTSLSTSGNVTGGNILTAGVISSTGNITGGNIIGTIVGTISTTSASVSGNITGGNILTGGLISAAGNITGTYLFGNASQVTGLSASKIFNGTTEANIGTSGGNANITVGGTSNVFVAATTGVYVTGVISANGNITGGNISATNHTGTTVSVSGTVTAASTVGGVITGSSASVTGAVTGASVVGGSITLSGNTIVSSGATLTIDPNAAGGVDGAVVIAGNLSVQGNVTYIDSNVITTNELSITLGNNQSSGTALNGAGIDIGNATQYYWRFNNATTSWQSNIGLTPAANATLSLGSTSNYWATLYATGVSASGNITGGNIVTGGAIAITGASTAGSYSTAGNITGGNVSVGTGTVTLGGIVNANGNAVGNIGSSTGYFNTVFAKATSAQYADLAEMYCADSAYTPGTVLEFGGAEEVTITTQSHSTLVAGIVSTNPSYLMNSTLNCKNSLEVALVGRVPCRVVGTIAKGDRLVASSIPGTATRLNMAHYQPGCIIGKALEAYDSDTVGTIEVAVGRN